MIRRLRLKFLWTCFSFKGVTLGFISYFIFLLTILKNVNSNFFKNHFFTRKISLNRNTREKCESTNILKYQYNIYLIPPYCIYIIFIMIVPMLLCNNHTIILFFIFCQYFLFKNIHLPLSMIVYICLFIFLVLFIINTICM